MTNKQPLVFFKNLDYSKANGVKGPSKAPSPGVRKQVDDNDLQDPYEDQGITPLAPISPAEVAPIGMLDGIYPKSDLEGKPNSNLYYGIMETHEFSAQDGKTDKHKAIPINSHSSTRGLQMPITVEAQGFIEVVELPQEHPIMEMLEQEQGFPELVMEHPTTEMSAATTMVEECPPEQMELVVQELPGVEGLDPELEKALEVVEEEPKDKDENDAKQAKKPTKWDWEEKGAKGFIPWLKERLVDVPKHSGYDKAGLMRAVAYMEKLDDEISRAMKADLDGELDANQIEEVRAKIENGIERLHDRLDKITKKTKKRRKKSDEEMSELVKQAQKSPTVSGIVITVPLLISRIARVCLNGMISAGHDIETIYQDQVKKYKLNDREQAELMQHLADLGMPLRQDRGYLPDEDVDTTNGKYDWASNYPA